MQEATEKAITMARTAGYFPARWQRPVNDSAVQLWANRAKEKGFTWEAGNHDTDAIVIGRIRGADGFAIHAGQHRILGGLLAGNPVPWEIITIIGADDTGKVWEGESQTGGGFSVDDLLYALAL